MIGKIDWIFHIHRLTKMSASTSTRFDFTVKIILLGDHNVGKTSLLADLASLRDTRESECRCVDYRPNGHVDLDVWKNGKRILAKIVDTGGENVSVLCFCLFVACFVFISRTYYNV